MRRLRQAALALAGVALLITLAVLMFAGEGTKTLRRGVPKGADFLSFYSGATLLAEGPPDGIYDHRRLHRVEHRTTHTRIHFQNLYPPPIYQALRPFLPLGYLRGAQLHLATMALLLTFACGLLARAGPPLPPGWPPGGALLAVAPFAWMNLLTGQLAGVWVAALAGGLLLLRRDRAFAGGLVLALLCCKPSLGGVAALFLLLLGQGRALLGFTLGGALILLVSLALDGPEPWRAWVQLMTGDRPGAFFVIPHRQITLKALFVWPLVEAPELARWVARAAMGGGLLSAAWLARRAWGVAAHDPRWPLLVAPVLSLLVLSLPHSVEYDGGWHGLTLLAGASLLGRDLGGASSMGALGGPLWTPRLRVGAVALGLGFVAPVLFPLSGWLGVSLGSAATLVAVGWVAAQGARIAPTTPRAASA